MKKIFLRREISLRDDNHIHLAWSSGGRGLNTMGPTLRVERAEAHRVTVVRPLVSDPTSVAHATDVPVIEVEFDDQGTPLAIEVEVDKEGGCCYYAALPLEGEGPAVVHFWVKGRWWVAAHQGHKAQSGLREEWRLVQTTAPAQSGAAG